MTKFHFISLAASIDLDSIYSGHHQPLQDVLHGVAFCDVSAEFKHIDSDEVTVPPQGFSKLFKVAQLIIQYLLHSQNQLTEAINSVRSDNDDLNDANQMLRRKIQERNKEIESLRIECKKRKKVIQTQQECIYQGKDPGSFQKCQFCPKSFVNESYLMSHYNRRHSHLLDQIQRPTHTINQPSHHQDANQDILQGLEKLHQEILSLPSKQPELYDTPKVKDNGMLATYSILPLMEEIRAVIGKQESEIEALRKQLDLQMVVVLDH